MRERSLGGLRFGTLAVHAGVSPEPTTGASMTPIFHTSTYVQPAVGEPLQGSYDYGRTANPTREALEASIAALENGSRGIAFSSGLAAIEAIVKRLSAGDHVVSEENTYGGTTRMFNHVLSRFGIEFSYVDTRDSGAIEAANVPHSLERRGVPYLDSPRGASGGPRGSSGRRHLASRSVFHALRPTTSRLGAQ